jgi:GNAT superfamily N-acetyltransferase
MIYFETEFDYDQVVDLIGKQKHFRYFETRSQEIFDSHVHHVLLRDESTYVGYGHLDAELNKLWLGMCVFDPHQFKGYGKAILKNLITRFTRIDIQIKYSKIHLTVDKENFSAINLYLSNRFRIVQQTDSIYYCERKCYV